MRQGQGSRRLGDPRRAQSFADAVLAITITLLVLNLLPPRFPPGGLLRGLLGQWPAYLAYLASYLYVAVVWLNHKAAFRRLRYMNRGLHWANQTILFFTALLPLATTVLANALGSGNRTDEQTALGLYALVGMLLAGSWLVFDQYVSRHPELIAEDVAADFFATERYRALVGVVLYAVGGALGTLVATPIALVVFLVLPLFYAVTDEGLYVYPAARHPRSLPHDRW